MATLWRYHIACGPVNLSSISPLWTTLPEETGFDAVNGLSCRCLIFYKNLTKNVGVYSDGCAEAGGYTRYANLVGELGAQSVSVVAGWFVETMLFVFFFIIFFILVVF